MIRSRIMRPGATFVAARTIVGKVGIVGAGPTGLTLATLLNRLGVPTVVFEKNDELPTHPQAHYVNGRTMEILRHDIGIEASVLNLSPPQRQWRDFVFSTSVFGGRELARVDNFTSKSDDVVPLLLRSASRPTHLSQPRLTQLLLDAARTPRGGLAPDIRFGCSLVDFQERGDGVEVTLGSGEKENVKYLIAADGASSLLREKLGIAMVGPENMATLMNIHFRLPAARQRLDDATAMLYFIYNPEVVAVFVNHGSVVNEPHEWVCQVPFVPTVQSVSSFDPAECRKLVAAGLGIPQGDVEILSVKPWTMHAQVAESYRGSDNSRVFLVGDAAHRFPPAGGFGMNTGIQDAHNLAFKLSEALESADNDDDEHALLSTYQTERRPVAVNNTILSKRNYERVLDITALLGVDGDRLLQAGKMLDRLGLDQLVTQTKAVSAAALSLARAPLRCLVQEGHAAGEAKVAQLRELLRHGNGGLALIFPRHELAFRYPFSDQDDQRRGALEIQAGNRAPHCRFILRNPASSTTSSASSSSASSSFAVFTLTDLPAQLHENGITQGRGSKHLRPTVLVIDSSRYYNEWQRDRCGLAPSEVCRIGVVLTIDTGDEEIEGVSATKAGVDSSFNGCTFPPPPWNLPWVQSLMLRDSQDGVIRIEGVDAFGDWRNSLAGTAFLIRHDGHIHSFSPWSTTKGHEP